MRYAINQQYFSEKKFKSMLKNILTEHAELLLFINYKQYICNMEELKEFIKASQKEKILNAFQDNPCLLYTSPSPRDMRRSRMPSSA